MLPTIHSDSKTAELQISENNWCLLDMQNLYQGAKEHGWKISWKCFRKYLKEKYGVTRAVAFMGYIKEYQALYNCLREAGFVLEFRPVRRLKNGMLDGANIDCDLASYVMDYKHDYHQAIIVADDGDYYRTIKSLNAQNKLKLIISSHLIRNTSEIIKQAVSCEQILSIHSLRNQIAYSQAI